MLAHRYDLIYDIGTLKCSEKQKNKTADLFHSRCFIKKLITDLIVQLAFELD